MRECGFLNCSRPARWQRCGQPFTSTASARSVQELAADYDSALTGSLRWQLYEGFAGEAALGPVSFPHRASRW